MKVLQVLPALNSGGVERGTLEVAQALVNANHKSWVLSAGGKLVDSLQQAGTKHITWDLSKKTPFTLFHVGKLRRWLHQESFDVVHLRSRMPAWVVWLAWRGMDSSTRPRLVSTVHGLHSVSRYSEIITCGEKIIAVSKSVEDYIHQNYPRRSPGTIAKERIQLIYRGIDPVDFPQNYSPDKTWVTDWRQQYPSLDGFALITLAGRMTRLKGHLDLIDILAELKRRGLKVKALIVGDEDPKRKKYAIEVKQKIQSMGLQDDIVLTGFRNDIKDIYAISDVVLSLSNKPESFGRSVLEPLSMGVPVVGYNHGGVGEILECLYPEGAVALNNKEAVVSSIEKQLLGNRAPIRPNDQFLLKTMTNQTLGLYENLIASPRVIL